MQQTVKDLRTANQSTCSQTQAERNTANEYGVVFYNAIEWVKAENLQQVLRHFNNEPFRKDIITIFIPEGYTLFYNKDVMMKRFLYKNDLSLEQVINLCNLNPNKLVEQKTYKVYNNDGAILNYDAISMLELIAQIVETFVEYGAQPNYIITPDDHKLKWDFNLFVRDYAQNKRINEEQLWVQAKQRSTSLPNLYTVSYPDGDYLFQAKTSADFLELIENLTDERGWPLSFITPGGLNTKWQKMVYNNRSLRGYPDAMLAEMYRISNQKGVCYAH